MLFNIRPMAKFVSYIGFVILVLMFFILSVQHVFGQSEEELKKELEKTEQEIAEEQRKLDMQKAQSNVIQGEVNKLTSQINTAQKNINEKANAIKEIGSDINIKDQTVNQLNNKLDRSTDILAEIVRTKNQVDDISLVEVMLAYDNLSEFYEGVDSIVTVQTSIDALLDQVRELRGLTEEEKLKLEEKKQREQDVKAQIEAEKNKVAVKQGEQKNLLATSKSVEAIHEQTLAEKRAKANAIRTALFKLRDSAGISFGDALKYAEAASAATGVRTAFILAILKQESNLGTNVGTCNRPGDPEEKKWYNIMPGPTSGSWRDDQTIYVDIVKKLGRDPETTPLSCPIGNGWGGAMGPSQFIPTTWRGYEARVAAALGVPHADPWNPQHAFMATAIYMKDLGAGAQTYSAEHTAALKYYAGGNWSLPQNQFYGNQVMGHAATFQDNITFLEDVED
jgi:membrane-bound lytic murein transglycosylase B